MDSLSKMRKISIIFKAEVRLKWKIWTHLTEISKAANLMDLENIFPFQIKKDIKVHIQKVCVKDMVNTLLQTQNILKVNGKMAKNKAILIFIRLIKMGNK